MFLRVRCGSPLPALLLALAAPLCLAQEKTSVTETVRAVVIEIPVNVIGKDGKPVAGLTAEDFELYDEGKKQQLSGFEVIDLNRAADPKAPNPFTERPEVSPAARRRFLIVFDFSYSSPSGLLRARNGARNFVTSGLKEADLAAVATFSVDTGWKLLVNFTRDRTQLSGAIETLGLPGLAVRASDPLSFAFLPPSATRGGGGGAKAEIDAALLETAKDFERMQQGASDDRARGRVAELMRSFEIMARALDSVRGRKHVLYFSEGFESRLLAGGPARTAFEPETPNQDVTAEAAVSGEVWKIDSDARFGSSSTRGRLTDALSAFNRNDCTLHTVDISGLRAEGDVADKSAGSGKDALFTMASETGGEFIRNANELTGQLDALLERTGLTYLLIYQPETLEKPGQFHRLRVKVKASGARVAARSGYYEPKPYGAFSPIERVLAAGDLVTSGAGKEDVPARLLAAAFPAGAGLSQVPVILEIPGGPLLAQDAGGQTSVELYAYASDATGTLTDYLTQTMALDLTKLRASLEAGGIKFYGTLHLPPGDYTLRTLVRNANTGRSGNEITRLRVVAIPGEEPVLLPPVFEEAPGRWVMVKGNPRSDAPPRNPEYPFAVGGESFIPAAMPVFQNGQEAKLSLFTYNFGGGAKPLPLELRSEVVAPDGQTRPAALRVATESGGERAGGRKLRAIFKPEGLPPGRYVLKVAVSDSATKKTADSFSVFEVK
jgi:VWFA-related protein